MKDIFDAIFWSFNNPAPSAPPPQPTSVDPDDVRRVTVQKMIDRKSGVIRINGKCYKFSITEVEVVGR